MFYNINRKIKNMPDSDKYEAPSKAGCDRLKSVLLSDKSSSASRIHNVIKSDLYCMLLNYMEVEPQSVRVDISCDAEGYYIFKAEAVAKRILNISFPPID